MANMFNIQTPTAQTIRVGQSEGTLQWNPNFGSNMSARLQQAQNFIDSECLWFCEPFVPKDTGALIQSGDINTRIGSGKVIYLTPYARRWYYRPASFQEAPIRGNYWFERMKQQYKEQILAGAKRIIREG